MIYPNIETETKMKKLFAAAFVRMPDNPFGAARTIETEQVYFLQIGNKWPTDSEVLQYRREIIGNRGPLATVPTKEEFAATVYEEVRTAKDAKDKLAFMQFFARVMNYIDNDKAGVNINLGGGSKTMVVPLAASDEDWQRRAQEHTAMLNAQHG